jgi:F-type H+-transporting ATPase subunit d
MFIHFDILFGAQKKISTMTVDEYFEKHPEVKQKFDDEIRNDNWGY